MYRSLSETLGAAAAAVVAFFAVVFVCAGLSVFGWWLDAKLSAPAGAAQQQIQNNSGTNRTTAQDAFNQLHAAIAADQVKIARDRANLAAHGASSTFDEQNLQLDQAKCDADVSDYNTDANDATMKDWRPSSYPASYDLSACS